MTPQVFWTIPQDISCPTNPPKIAIKKWRTVSGQSVCRRGQKEKLQRAGANLPLDKENIQFYNSPYDELKG
jgi:hypothetical protein